MAAAPSSNLDDGGLVAAARGGDERAFVELTSPHRSALHAHCYRLLGSLHDADDGLQETLLRAWRGIDRFEPRAPVAAWLYRIATNVCLRMLEQRSRRQAAVDAHLEPYPDWILEQAASPLAGPEASAETREAIGLAFVAAMQLLPPKQRAVLVLRDVLDWSAREVADLFQDSVAAVNSALQRARERLAREQEEGSLARAHVPTDAGTEAVVMRRFQDAWEAVDIDGIVALLAADALLTMPPESVSIAGAAEIGTFFSTAPMEGRLDRIRLLPVRANGQPALAAYAEDEATGTHNAYGVMVFAMNGDSIVGITGFPDRPEIFERLGLPSHSQLDGPGVGVFRPSRRAPRRRRGRRLALGCAGARGSAPSPDGEAPRWAAPPGLCG